MPLYEKSRPTSLSMATGDAFNGPDASNKLGHALSYEQNQT